MRAREAKMAAQLEKMEIVGYRSALEIPSDDPDLMRRALLHVVHRELSRGWGGWTTMLAALARKRAAMKRALGHMLHVSSRAVARVAAAAEPP